MKRKIHWISGLAGMVALVWASGQFSRPAADAPDTSGATYEAQKATALSNPYANDYGPASIDVSSYPPEIQETYRKFLQTPNSGCQRCHTAARPLNSQFVEPSGAKEEEAAKVVEWKASHPEWF